MMFTTIVIVMIIIIIIIIMINKLTFVIMITPISLCVVKKYILLIFGKKWSPGASPLILKWDVRT